MENTSWSCFHGVERWRSNCGCNSGGHPGWNQKWRGPLRNALDFVRDELIKTFETLGAQYFKNVWDARNDYISIILDRSLDAQHRFFLKHATETAWRNRASALMLLEMQRNAMLMYTSCGWFFDEISGLETVQIMHYAARALELNKQLTGHDLEPQFISLLEKAPSNLPELKTGAVVYEKYVKPQKMPVEKIALEYVVSLLSDETTNPKRIYAYDVLNYAPVKLQHQDLFLCYGDITLKSTVTLQENTLAFAILRKGPAAFICCAGALADKNCLTEIAKLFEEKKYEDCAEKLRTYFEKQYPISSMLLDVRRKVVEQACARMDQETSKQFSQLFEHQYPLVRGLQLIGTPVPPSFLTVAKQVLVEDLKDQFRAANTNINELEELMEEVKTLGLNVSADLKEVITKRLTFLAFEFAREPQKKQHALKLVEFLNYLEIFDFQADTVKAQEFVFLGLRALGNEAKTKDILRALARKLKIAL